MSALSVRRCAGSRLTAFGPNPGTRTRSGDFPHPADDDALARSPEVEASGAGTGSATAVERRLLAWMLEHAGRPPLIVRLWDGSEVTSCPDAGLPRATIRSRRALWRILTNPGLQMGDCYTEGLLDFDADLAGVLEGCYGAAPDGRRFSQALGRLLAAWQGRIGRMRAARSAAHHYDAGNDFYVLWLDASMTYTCAYFPEPDCSLEQAQEAKLDRVCRKLDLRPGERVVEAGCGWGSLALHMARRYGVEVSAYNISGQQIAWARERAEREGLAGRVRFIEADYRDIAGTFDAFVSVGMLEHVGRRHYPELGKIVARCLTSDGRGLVHSIGRTRPMPTNAWIAKRIFPGGYTPSLAEMMAVFEPNALTVLDVENLRLHYARTLEHWLGRLEAHGDRIVALLDEHALRTWRLYLASAIASFRTGWLQLFQVTFARSGSNAIRWTRHR